MKMLTASIRCLNDECDLSRVIEVSPEDVTELTFAEIVVAEMLDYEREGHRMGVLSPHFAVVEFEGGARDGEREAMRRPLMPTFYVPRGVDSPKMLDPPTCLDDGPPVQRVAVYRKVVRLERDAHEPFPYVFQGEVER